MTKKNNDFEEFKERERKCSELILECLRVNNVHPITAAASCLSIALGGMISIGVSKEKVDKWFEAMPYKEDFE